MPNSAMAMPCSFGGNVWRKMACSVGWSAPAPKPWIIRKATSAGRVRAMPQSAEPATKMTRQAR
jgi:hypothetical protein